MFRTGHGRKAIDLFVTGRWYRRVSRAVLPKPLSSGISGTPIREWLNFLSMREAIGFWMH